MNTDITKIKSIDELEFRCLKDLSELKAKAEAEKQKADTLFNSESETESMMNIIKELCDIGYNHSRIKFIGLVDDEVGIFLTQDYTDNELCEVKDKSIISMSKDENVVIIKDGYDNITFVHKEMLDKPYLEQMKQNIDKFREAGDIYKYFKIKDNKEEDTYKVITKEIAEAKIKEAVAEAVAEKKEAEAKAKEEELQQDKQAETKRIDYEQKGIYKAEEDDEQGENSGIVIEGSILKRKCSYGRTYSFEFAKPVKEVFTFDEVKDLDDGEQNKLLSVLVDKKVGFEYWYSDKEIANLSFQGDRIKINDIPVAKAKVLFILGNIRSNDANKTKIELYSKLSGMKVDVLELKEIVFYLNGINKGSKENEDNISIPISISLLDENFFKLTMFDKTIPLNWERIKYYFFENDCEDIHGKKKISRSTHSYFKLKKFQELTQEMAMEKAFVFENLNKLRLFNAI